MKNLLRKIAAPLALSSMLLFSPVKAKAQEIPQGGYFSLSVGGFLPSASGLQEVLGPMFRFGAGFGNVSGDWDLGFKAFISGKEGKLEDTKINYTLLQLDGYVNYLIPLKTKKPTRLKIGGGLNYSHGFLKEGDVFGSDARLNAFGLMLNVGLDFSLSSKQTGAVDSSYYYARAQTDFGEADLGGNALTFTGNFFVPKLFKEAPPVGTGLY